LSLFLGRDVKKKVLPRPDPRFLSRDPAHCSFIPLEKFGLLSILVSFSALMTMLSSLRDAASETGSRTNCIDEPLMPTHELAGQNGDLAAPFALALIDFAGLLRETGDASGAARRMVSSFVGAISTTEQIACSVLRRWTAEGGCPHMSQTPDSLGREFYMIQKPDSRGGCCYGGGRCFLAKA
jgi:hypothetical protein